MLGPNPKILAYLFALEQVDKARKVREAAQLEEDKAQKDFYNAKADLALEFGYVAGKPPMVISVEPGRCIRLSSRERDRDSRCSGRDSPPEILAVIEKLV